jgi:cell division protein ZapA (FtsZ GTPase activity inhibitor)
MGKNEKTPITVNDKEYFVDDMTEQQQAMVNHITDLDRKMASMRFNLDQLNVGRDAFVNMLTQSLQSEEVTDADYDEPIADD